MLSEGGARGDLRACSSSLGPETTTVLRLISNGTLALLKNPAQLEDLRAHPDLIPGAVEEILRYDGAALTAVRRALVDVEVGGQRIAAGQFTLHPVPRGQPRPLAGLPPRSSSTSTARMLRHLGGSATGPTTASALPSRGWRPRSRSARSSSACPVSASRPTRWSGSPASSSTAPSPSPSPSTRAARNATAPRCRCATRSACRRGQRVAAEHPGIHPAALVSAGGAPRITPGGTPALPPGRRASDHGRVTKLRGSPQAALLQPAPSRGAPGTLEPLGSPLMTRELAGPGDRDPGGGPVGVGALVCTTRVGNGARRARGVRPWPAFSRTGNDEVDRHRRLRSGGRGQLEPSLRGSRPW